MKLYGNEGSEIEKRSLKEIIGIDVCINKATTVWLYLYDAFLLSVSTIVLNDLYFIINLK